MSKVRLVIECEEQTYAECKRISGLSETAYVIANGTPITELKEIPKDFCYDTETDKFLIYRNKYTGEEIHIIKEPKVYSLAKSITEGDLISRSALKEQFADIRPDFPKFHQFSFVSTEEIARKIDNAPSIGGNQNE